MRHTYSIGLDYGTLSLRGILVDTQTGEKMAEALSEYADGIIDQFLPQDEVRLLEGFALQNPQNYIDSTLEVLSSLVRTSGVQAHEIIGIGLDSTASTLIPVDKSFQPLCFQERFRKNPHAWIKLWKHHGAQEQADKLNHCARTMKMPFLTRIGGVLSSEYAYPKILETLEKAPEVYAATHRFMEIGDWIVWLLTGEETRNAVLASFHMQWDIEKGFPPNDFFRMVHPGLDGLVENKLGTNVHSAYSRAGGISQEIATRTGLLPAPAYAVPMEMGIFPFLVSTLIGRVLAP